MATSQSGKVNWKRDRLNDAWVARQSEAKRGKGTDRAVDLTSQVMSRHRVVAKYILSLELVHGGVIYKAKSRDYSSDTTYTARSGELLLLCLWKCTVCTSETSQGASVHEQIQKIKFSNNPLGYIVTQSL